VQSAVDWLRVLPVLVALPAAAILVWGLARGRLPPAVAMTGLTVPAVAYGFGILLVMEESNNVRFFGSCPAVGLLGQSLAASADASLAATRYQRGLVPTAEGFYTCHSGYGIWGTFGAKKAGVMHMLRALAGRYAMPLRINGTFDIASCLGCHAG